MDNLFIARWIVGFSYSLIITCIWWKQKKWIRIVWLASIPLLVIGFELFQRSGIIDGTFCKLDLFVALVGSLSGFFLGLKLSQNHHKNEKFNFY